MRHRSSEWKEAGKHGIRNFPMGRGKNIKGGRTSGVEYPYVENPSAVTNRRKR